MAKMMLMKELMDERVREWKEHIVSQLNNPEFELPGLNHDDSLMIHYTPRWPLVVHYICAILMFGMSSIYHTFNCKNEECCTFYIKFDYAGICFMIGGSGSAPIYYAFACSELEQFRWIYFGILWTCCIITMVLMMFPYFDQPHFNNVRVGLFVATACSNFFPLFHIIMSVDSTLLHHFYVFPWLLGMLLYLVGGVLYALHWPEAYFSKKNFDIFGNSHQLMHIMIIAASLVHYYASIQFFHDRQLFSCPLNYTAKA